MLDIKCPSCSHTMEFNTATGNLTCSICSFSTHITKIDMPEYGSYQKSSYINELEVKDTDNITEAPDSSDTITDKNNAYISEFIPKSKTCLLLRKWAGKSIFTCKSFNRALSNEDITLKYVPIYIFKTNASAVLTGAAVKIDDKDDSAHRITRTHYYNITHKVTINNYRKAFSATDDMSDIILEDILPYDFTCAKKYDDNTVCEGNICKLSKKSDDIPDKAQKPIIAYMNNILLSSTKEYSSIHNYSTTPYMNESEIKTVYVPIWEMRYNKKQYSHPVYVNAQTGKISGESPESPLRIALCLIITGIILSALAICGILLI